MSQPNIKQPIFTIVTPVLTQTGRKDENEEPEDDVSRSPQSPHSPTYSKGKIIQGEEPEDDDTENSTNQSSILSSQQEIVTTNQMSQKPIEEGCCSIVEKKQSLIKMFSTRFNNFVCYWV
jgi:hypothetical protein